MGPTEYSGRVSTREAADRSLGGALTLERRRVLFLLLRAALETAFFSSSMLPLLSAFLGMAGLPALVFALFRGGPFFCFAGSGFWERLLLLVWSWTLPSWDWDSSPEESKKFHFDQLVREVDASLSGLPTPWKRCSRALEPGLLPAG